MKEISLIDEIKNLKHYPNVLLTTYTFDVDFFEKILLDYFSFQRKNLLICIDSNEYYKTFDRTNLDTKISIGKKYFMQPIFLKNTFHPKITLASSSNRMFLMVNSANFTKSGLTDNAEILNIFRLDSEAIENLNIFLEVKSFFEALINKSYVSSKDYEKLIKKSFENQLLFQTAKSNSDIHFVHNLEISIFDQVSRYIDEEINEINIISPFYSKDLELFERMLARFNCNINVVIQQGNTNLPKSDLVNFKWIKKLKFFDITFKDNRDLHGKLMIFKGKKNSFCLSGSANFTNAAFLGTCKDGNIEAGIIRKGNDFNNLFKDLIKEIKLDEIEVIKETEEETYAKYELRILEAYIKNTNLVITTDLSLTSDKVEVYLDELNKKYDSKISLGKIQLKLEKIPLSGCSVWIKVREGDKIIESDKRWIHNPPNPFLSMGEYADIVNDIVDDEIKPLFTLISEYKEIPKFIVYYIRNLIIKPFFQLDFEHRYKKIIPDFNPDDFMHSIESLDIKQCKKEELIQEILNHFMNQNDRLMERYIKNPSINHFYSFIQHFKISNKLAIAAACSNLVDINILANIRTNYDYFNLLIAKLKVKYSSEEVLDKILNSELDEHILLVPYIVHILQERKTGINMHIKEVFERSFAKVINKFFKKQLIKKLGDESLDFLSLDLIKKKGLEIDDVNRYITHLNEFLD